MSNQNISNPNPTGEYFKPQQKSDNSLKWYFKTSSQNHSTYFDLFWIHCREIYHIILYSQLVLNNWKDLANTVYVSMFLLYFMKWYVNLHLA